MKYYHLSKDVFKNISVFEPTIPEYIMKEEDRTIPRICVGKTIIDCLNGICYLDEYYNNLFKSTENNCDYNSSNFRVMKVYEFELSEMDSIKTPIEIVEYVPDALRTNEHWVLNDIEPINEYLIQIMDLTLVTVDNVGFISDCEVTPISHSVIASECYIAINNKTLLAEAIESLDDINLNNTVEGSVIKLNVSGFPSPKNLIEGALKDYFSWVPCKITLT